MLVLLKRDFKDENRDGGYWRRDSAGVEMPEKYRDCLPHDAKILEDEEMTEDEVTAAKKSEELKKPQKPVARSELAPKAGNVKGITPPV